MNGREVFKFATRIMVYSAEQILAECGKTVEDVELDTANTSEADVTTKLIDNLQSEPIAVDVATDLQIQVRATLTELRPAGERGGPSGAHGDAGGNAAARPPNPPPTSSNATAGTAPRCVRCWTASAPTACAPGSTAWAWRPSSAPPDGCFRPT